MSMDHLTTVECRFGGRCLLGKLFRGTVALLFVEIIKIQMHFIEFKSII